MIEGVFNQASYVTAKKMLDATALRHQAIASNIANIETPNYKRIDIAKSFDVELRRASDAQDASRLETLQPQLEIDTTAVAGNRDGNTVQLEKELINLQQNTLAHALQTQLITSQLARLRQSISGQA